MKKIVSFETGSSRGYCSVKECGLESDFIKVPDSLKGLRGNFRKAMSLFIDNDCDYYTVAKFPYYRSNQYCYYVYYGYKKEEKNE